MKRLLFLSLLTSFSWAAIGQSIEIQEQNLGAMTLGDTQGTFFNVAGAQRGTDVTNQPQGGFGLLSGGNQISPVVWMYAHPPANAFQVRKKGWGQTIQNGDVLFHVGANNLVGIGTPIPTAKLHVVGNTKIFGTDEAWAEGVLIVKPNGWSGVRLSRTDPTLGNFNGNWALGYNANTGNDFSISTNFNGTQYDALFHISNSTRNVGIGIPNPSVKLEVGGAIKSHEPSHFGGYSAGSAGSNSYSIEVGGQEPVNNSGRATIIFHHHGVIANQLRYYGGNLFWEATANGYGTTSTPNFFVGGSVGVGTTATGPHRLAVEGSIGAREVKVSAGPGWPDYVFEDDYALTPLSELETYVKENHHLPEVPSEQEVLENGVELGATVNLLLKKIEELTLYTIEQQKAIDKLMTSNNQLREQVNSLSGK